mgnify:FL=1
MPAGQKIKIKLPTISADIEEEYLMNIDTIERIFAPEIKLIYTRHYMEFNEIEIADDDKEYLNCIKSYFF